MSHPHPAWLPRCRLRSDLLLGVASVSLSALLQECWVDGYAPVYALMAKAAADEEQQEKVQVRLRRGWGLVEFEQEPPYTTILYWYHQQITNV